MNNETRPKPLFYIAVLAVVLGLLIYGFRSVIFPKSETKGPGTISKEDITQAQGVEAPDANVPTTVKEYVFKPSEKLPPIAQTSGYEPLANRTVKFALNVWAGWAPIILQNGGGAAGKEWTTPGGQPFKVELVLIDNPVSMRDAYASGKVHIGWATLDMLPLFMDELKKDARIMPRVYQQVDFSNGGDGIVIRRNAAKDPKAPTIADLRKKKVVLAQNSPSEYFLLNALVNGGVQPAEVNFVYTEDAFQAAAAFNADKSIAACVSWAPDIYNLSKIDGNHLLVSTATANKLIADVWFARGDFARDHADICEGLARGIFDGMAKIKTDDGKKQAAALMAKLYSIPEADTLGMLGDAHSTNYAENREFFLNQNNPANFERTWNTAYLLYRKMNKIKQQVPFDQVMDFSIIQKLAGEEPYKSSRNEYQINFAPKTVQSIKAEGSEILTKVVTLHFYPNSWDLRKTITVQEDGKEITKPYEPGVDNVLEEVGKLAAQYGAANIVVEGHTDSSMKNQVSPQTVKELSSNRAAAVKTELLKKFPNFNVNQFSTDGVGWDRPFDPEDPLNHAKNRRVEIKVIALENPE
ncbi:MAG TPA: phosphate ABC transporter substrate-binding/OmpA family protein [Verrucomicrobiales bacterium]|jgi:ABC-type nitrate/sulfonate/bicarbonate transport system substrate-binding protein/outer membrane protein OmpA-like peptidoglycan-associated protein|nr:phosphate ABC transporter substrate-binding/OmpA family protein [Verrucomicrobiales bacterium]